MDFIELSKKRFSVRDFSDRQVEEEKLQKILEAGRLSPTAINAQPQKIFVLKSPEALEKIRKATRMAYNAPIVMLVCYDENISWKGTNFGDNYDAGEMDCCIITTAMMMQATELGLGTLWARGYNGKDISEAFSLPDNIKQVCLLDVGYPAEGHEPNARHFKRKELSETVEVL